MYIGSVSTLGGVYSSSSYTLMGVGVGDIFCVDVGARVCRQLVIFTIGDAIVLVGLFHLTSTLVCDVSFWGVSCGVVFLDIYDFLMACNLLSPMYSNGDVGAGLEIASSKYIAALVSAYLLYITSILLCSGGNSTASVISSALVSLSKRPPFPLRILIIRWWSYNPGA